MISNVSKWQSLLVRHDQSIEETILEFENDILGFRIVHNSGKFIGVITNGDLRRSFLAGISPASSTIKITNCDAITASTSTTDEELESISKKFGIEFVPVVESTGEILGLKRFVKSFEFQPLEEHIVFMAGGKGTRLLQETADLPKPLVRIQGKPLLEHLITKAHGQGFRKVIISIGHLGNKIEEYFGEGDELGVEITYIREEQPLGSAGALSLLSRISMEVSENFIVANGDVLSNINLRSFLDFQKNAKSLATVVGKLQQSAIPYGVLNLLGDRLQSIEEKPLFSYTINAGIYGFKREVIEHLDSNVPLSMTELLQKLLDRGEIIRVFQNDDEWIDIGTPENLKFARERL